MLNNNKLNHPSYKVYVPLIVLVLFTFTSVHGQYYYTGKTYGSEAMFNPVNVVLNNGFDIIQLGNKPRTIFDFPYSHATKNLWKSITHPGKTISEYGVNKFITNELFPLTFGIKGAQWWPNYNVHLIGGGMTYRMLIEWYEYHNYPQPKLLSIATVGAFHFLNEVVENGHYDTKLRIYRFEGAIWVEEKVFDVPNYKYPHQFSFSGERLAVAVGNVESDDTPRKTVCVYVFDGDDWVQEAMFTSPVYASEDLFGGEVVISDGICVVGSVNDWWEQGQVFVYELIDDMWTLTGHFDKWDFQPGAPHIESFGHGIACDDEHILATAYNDSGWPVFLSFKKCPTMDLTGDCFVTTADLQIFAEQWLTGRR